MARSKAANELYQWLLMNILNEFGLDAMNSTTRHKGHASCFPRDHTGRRPIAQRVCCCTRGPCSYGQGTWYQQDSHEFCIFGPCYVGANQLCHHDSCRCPGANRLGANRHQAISKLPWTTWLWKQCHIIHSIHIIMHWFFLLLAGLSSHSNNTLPLW